MLAHPAGDRSRAPSSAITLTSRSLAHDLRTGATGRADCPLHQPLLRLWLLSWRSGVYPIQPEAATPSVFLQTIFRTAVRPGGNPGVSTAYSGLSTGQSVQIMVTGYYVDLFRVTGALRNGPSSALRERRWLYPNDCGGPTHCWHLHAPGVWLGQPLLKLVHHDIRK